MSEKFIAMVIYDLPIKLSKDKKNYMLFRSNIMGFGFYQLQKSIYIKKIYSKEAKPTVINQVKAILPKKGDIRLIIFTLKQFDNTFHLLGEKNFCEVIVSEKSSVIEL